MTACAANWLVAMLAVASVFLSGKLLSLPGFSAVAWPCAWVLASRRSVLGRGIVLGAFMISQVMLLWHLFTWGIPP